jgi:dTDP-glucose 4,6-dehydratase
MKRMAELMCVTSGLDCVIARGFAFVGPYLPLTDKFAVGSFIRDALAGGPIRITGDGTPVRSYLYAADLAIWLLTLLVKAKACRPYNVGSDSAIALADLAYAVGRGSDNPVSVKLGRSRRNMAAERYVPSIRRVHDELGLTVRISLDAALRRTTAWAGRIGNGRFSLHHAVRVAACEATDADGNRTAP